MPALVIFGKRTPIAGDDLRVYAIVTLLVRLAQFGSAVASLMHTFRWMRLDPSQEENVEEIVDEIEEDKVCTLDEDEQGVLFVLAVSFLAFTAVQSLVGVSYALSIWIISQRGTPTDRRTRVRPLQLLCQVHLTWILLIRLFTVTMGLGLHSQLDDDCPCINEATEFEYACNPIYFVLFLFLFYTEVAEVCFDLLIIVYVTTSWIIPKMLPRGLNSEQQWRIFCQCCCTISSVLTCCLMGGPDAVLGDYTDIAMLLTHFFNLHGSLDITHSDMVIGLLLVKEVQEQRFSDIQKQIMESTVEEELITETKPTVSDESYRENLIQVMRNFQATKKLSGVTYRLRRYEGGHHRWEPAITKFLSLNSSSDRLIIAEGARFMQLSLAIYTWFMYSLNHPCTGLCSICGVAAIRMCKKPQTRYEGDGYCCRLHSAAFLKESGITDETEIVYAYFRSQIVASPYAVVLDHEWKSVVIVIRGTLSLEDVLTDLDVEPSCLKEVEGYQGEARYVHAGMQKTCQWIIQDMKKHNILENLYATQSKFSNYRLRITGHSLGAGCAAILALLLKPEYPTLRCHSFSPPGCTMSQNVASECEEYLTSFILDADVIPRASLNSLENLRQDAVEMIGRIKVTKTQVFDEYTHGCIKGDQESSRVDRLMYKEDEVPESEFVLEWRKYRQLYDQQKLARGLRIEIELFVPGKIVHLFQNKPHYPANQKASKRAGSNMRQYRARWANRLDFREIRICSHFLDDHMPMSVLQGLEGEAERFGLELPFVIPTAEENDP